jgi:hypothetical protein
MAFEVITSDTKINSLRIAKQLYVAYTHRMAALRIRYTIASEYVTEPDTDTNLYAYLKGLQKFVQEQAERFYDPSATLDGAEAYPSAMTFSGAAFASATGLSETGRWRRVPDGTNPPSLANWSNYDDTVYSYGAITLLDVAGPWLWQDLITAFEKLTRIEYLDDSAQKENYGDAESNAPAAGATHPLTGNIDWAYGLSGNKVGMGRANSGTELNPYTSSSFEILGTKRCVKYYWVDGISSVKNCCYMIASGSAVISSVISEVTSSYIGKLVCIEPRSTFTDDSGDSWLTSALLVKDDLTGTSRESLIVAEGLTYPAGNGVNDKLLTWSDPHFYVDYTFPDGATE